MAITVVLADDHVMFRKGLNLMLSEEPDICIVGEASDGEDAIRQVAEHRPDVVVMDISMPNVDGIEATQRVIAESPGTKVLALSMHSGKRFVENMLRAGAAGYVLKESAPEDVVNAVRAVHLGDMYLSPSISGVVVSEYMRLLDGARGDEEDEELTDSERSTLHLIAEGHSTKEIAAANDVSVSSVNSEKRRIIKKRGLRDAAALVEFARAREWAEGETQMQVSGRATSANSRGPILATKLRRPEAAPDAMIRNHLLSRLEEGRQHRLTLIAAPAGYGKSTLASQWLEASSMPSAWVSLEASDNDLRIFLNYFLAAIQTVVSNVGSETWALLNAPTLPSPSILAGYLSNELDDIDDPFMIALDDYHLIDHPGVHELVGLLLKNPPHSLHLLIITRHDPPLPLSAMRAHGDVTDIRLRDLQFNDVETAELVEQATGLAVSEPALQNLHKQLEGWIVGLQLVMQSLKHQSDPETFLLELRGSIREVQDYLLDQVVSQQPPEFQQCLLRLSVVDRFSAGFCQGVCPLHDQCSRAGELMMDRVHHSGLFTVRLDETGEWYRFHHLVQELLRSRLHQELNREAVEELHLGAGNWFASEGSIDEAIKHFLTAGDPTRAAELIERHWHAELDQDRWYGVEQWLHMLPAEIREQRPQLLLAKAWVLDEQWRLAEVIPIVERVEAILKEAGTDSAVSAELALIQGIICYWTGDTHKGRKCLDDARQLPESYRSLWGELEIHDSLALQRCGDAEQAVRKLKDRVRADDSSSGSFLSRLIGAQVFVRLLSGQLLPATRAAERLQVVAKNHESIYCEAWAAYLQASCALKAFNLDAARQHFERAAESRHVLHVKCAVDALSGLALTYQLIGRTDDATEMAKQLLQFAHETNDAEHLAVAYSAQSRLDVLQNNPASASRWAASFDEPVHAPEMFIWIEIPGITRIRVLIAVASEESLQEALTSLDALLLSTQELRNECQCIELVVLKAVALWKLGRSDNAVAALREAVSLTESGGWIRPFVEAGSPMHDMLREMINQRPTAWLQEILAAFGRQTHAPQSSAPQPLLDPLTSREEEILQLLSERLRDKEISDRLFVSTETVKSHLKHIYQKLRAKNRRDAVSVARELGLIKRQ